MRGRWAGDQSYKQHGVTLNQDQELVTSSSFRRPDDFSLRAPHPAAAVLAAFSGALFGGGLHSSLCEKPDLCSYFQNDFHMFGVGGSLRVVALAHGPK